MAERYRVLRGITYTPRGAAPAVERHIDPALSEEPPVVDDLPAFAVEHYLSRGDIEPVAPVAAPAEAPAPPAEEKGE